MTSIQSRGIGYQYSSLDQSPPCAPTNGAGVMLLAGPEEDSTNRGGIAPSGARAHNPAVGHHAMTIGVAHRDADRRFGRARCSAASERTVDLPARRAGDDIRLDVLAPFL